MDGIRFKGLRPEQKPGVKEYTRAGLVAAIAAFAGVEKPAEAQEVKRQPQASSWQQKPPEVSSWKVDVQPQLVKPPELAKRPPRQDSLDELMGFLTKVDGAPMTLEELGEMERKVLTEAVPLPAQIAFLQRGLGKDGYHYNQLRSKDLTGERYAQIMELASRVSARLTSEYGKFDASPKSEKEKHSLRWIFDVSKIRGAVRLKNLPGGGYCNESLAENGGEAWAITAAHCLRPPLAEKYRISLRNDQAVRFVPESEYREEYFRDVSELPKYLSDTSLESVSGKITVSLSWQRDASGYLVEKVDFSLLFPLPELERGSMRFDNWKPPEGSFKNAAVFIMPFGEGQVLQRGPSTPEHPDGKVLQIAASGRSGSFTGVHMGVGTEYYLAGPLSSVTITDRCKGRCYAGALIGDPADVNLHMEADRQIRREQARAAAEKRGARN